MPDAFSEYVEFKKQLSRYGLVVKNMTLDWECKYTPFRICHPINTNRIKNYYLCFYFNEGNESPFVLPNDSNTTLVFYNETEFVGKLKELHNSIKHRDRVYIPLSYSLLK